MSAKNEKDTSNYYVRNKDLLEELYKWRDSAENPDDRIISEKLGTMIYTIAKKLTNHFRFHRYPAEVKQDMISLGCYKVITGLKNYNFEFKRPFAYLTQICWNANVSTCIKYYKHKNGMKQYIIDAAAEVENTLIGPAKSVYLRQVQKSLQEFLDDLEAEDKEAEESKLDAVN